MADPAVDHPADHDPVLRDHGYHRLTIVAVVPETEDACSFVLDVPDDLAELFRYRPGQFCTFRTRIDGREHLRSYSMSTAPETDAALAVTVKRVPGGLVSNWFNDALSPGDVVEVTKPAGVFCPQESTRALVAFCGGSGITPVMSIVKSVLATTQRPVRLLYANRDPSSVIFGEQLEDLRGRHGHQLELRLHFDTDGGFLDAAAVDTFADASADADFYVCGPGPFMDLVESTLHRRGVTPDRIFIERFLVDKDEHAPPPVADAGAPGSGAGAPEALTIILGGKPKVVAYHAGDTVLETARRGGLRPPFSCEAGNCATCMAFLREGSVSMRANNALDADELAEGWILTCQSLPTSDVVTVEYEPM
jgi:ferredoxin-NADP reductase